MFARYRPETEATLKEALELFDDQGYGVVNMKTFHVAMTTQGAKVSEAEFREIVRNVRIDEVGDASIEGNILFCCSLFTPRKPTKKILY